MSKVTEQATAKITQADAGQDALGGAVAGALEGESDIGVRGALSAPSTWLRGRRPTAQGSGFFFLCGAPPLFARGAAPPFARSALTAIRAARRGDASGSAGASVAAGTSLAATAADGSLSPNTVPRPGQSSKRRLMPAIVLPWNQKQYCFSLIRIVSPLASLPLKVR